MNDKIYFILAMIFNYSHKILFILLIFYSVNLFAKDKIETDCETIHPKPQPIPTVIKI